MLGAVMYTIDIFGYKIVYTGDFNLSEDHFLPQSSIPSGSTPDLLLCESTYGNVNYKAKDIREKEVKDAICNTLNKNGKVLISEYPIGRAQELLCIIEQVLEEHHFDVFPFCSEPCLGSYLLQFILGTEFVALLSYLFKMDQSKESEQEHSHVSSPSKDEPQPPHTSM